MTKIKWSRNPTDEEILANFINVEDGKGRGIHGEEAWIEDSKLAFQEVVPPPVDKRSDPASFRAYISLICALRASLQTARGDLPSLPKPEEPEEPASDNKEKISIRIDKDILEWFRKDGTRWQSRVNDALREHMMAKSLTLPTLRG